MHLAEDVASRQPESCSLCSGPDFLRTLLLVWGKWLPVRGCGTNALLGWVGLVLDRGNWTVKSITKRRISILKLVTFKGQQIWLCIGLVSAQHGHFKVNESPNV
jgi:hypothetical protein